jgi:site-specific DNA recombinase
MEALQARKDTLQAQVSAVNDPPPPAVHPNVAEVFRQKATTLAEGLEHENQRHAAREALRGFVDKIVIPSGDGLLQIVGNLGAMLVALQAGQKMAGRQTVGYVGCGGGI